MMFKHMDANWFWVAITRCTDLDKINIITSKINGLKNYNLGAMINGYKKQDKEASSSTALPPEKSRALRPSLLLSSSTSSQFHPSSNLSSQNL